MATYTTNLNLKKPAGTDSALIGDINDNMDLIDEAVAARHILTAGTGIDLTGDAISIDDTAVTAGTYGPSADVTGTEGTTIKVPEFTVNGQGQITGVNERTYTSKDTTYTAGNGLSITGGEIAMTGNYSGNFTATKVYNAVWNDIAECREAPTMDGGVCVRDVGNGKMELSSKRLQAGCRLTSDTYGYCMGETENAKTPIAIAGRVLAIPSGRHDLSKWKPGKAVCACNCGTVDIMNRLECILFPDRIIGYVSEIPDYQVWKGGSKEDPTDVFVDDRVWVYVR